jgi:putative CRISPR-associated protein (TIGR02619 family)
MSTYMLISCGTSVLTNGVDAATRDRCSRLANERELDPEDRNWLDRHREATSRRLQAGGWTQARKQSAELNSLAAFLPAPPRNAGRPDHLVLLHTDTDLGRAAAQILKDWLDAQGYEARLHTTPGLATRSLEDFQASLSELVRWAWEEIPGYREAGFRIVFNLTGGFKGVLGFLQVLATLMADETIYLFEGSEQLLRIPRLPVKMAAEETVRQHLDTFRRMSVLDSVPADKCAGLPETLYFTHEGQAGLTPWGEMVWNQARERLYREFLPSPLTHRVVYQDAFRKTAEALAPNQLYTLNRNLDLLNRFIEEPEGPNLRALRFKKLKLPTEDGCTHEFYASSEGAAPRCYCSIRQDILVVERLGRHL